MKRATNALRDPRRGGKIAGLARVGMFFLVLAIVSVVSWTRHAKAEVAHESIRVGRDLAALADLVQGHHAIALNGEEVFLAHATTDQPVATVLDRVAEHCRTNPGAITDLFSDVARAERLSPKESASLLSELSIMRDEEEGEGVILCLAKNEGGSAVNALRAFGETMDLGALGKLRYVYARPDGAGRTHVLTVWTEGTFRVGRLLSEAEGRVPEDTRLVPRPPASRFLFDARIRDTQYGVRVYRTDATVGDVATFYDEEMARRGWDIVKPPVAGGVTRGYSNEGVVVVMGALVDKDNGGTLVSLAEIGARPAVRSGVP